MMRSKKYWLLAGTAFTALAVPLQAFAETPAQAETPAASGDEERVEDKIVVTARYREETAQDIGASITGLTGDSLREQGVASVDDLTRIVAGLQNVKTRPNMNNIAIRGVIDTKGGVFATSSVYSVFFDDISVTSPFSLREFSSVDLNRVEVVRGAQPTLFGEGAVGGVIRYVSNDPDLSGPMITGNANAQIGTIEDGGLVYDVDNSTSVVFVPEKLGLQLTGFFGENEGFIDNPNVGEDVNDYETKGGRAVLLARPNDKLEIRLSAFLSRDEIGESTQVDPGSDPEDLTFSVSTFNGSATDDFDLYSARVKYDFDALTLTSITGYYERNLYQAVFSAANTFGLAPFFASDTPGAMIDTTTFSVDTLDQEQWSQEFRLVSNFDGPLNFTSGLYYRTRDVSQVSLLDCAGCTGVLTPTTSSLVNSANTVESTQSSGFVELTYDISESLRLIGGVRYVDDTVETTILRDETVNFVPRFDDNGNVIPWTESDPLDFINFTDYLNALGYGTDFDFHLERFLPRVGMEYDVSDDILFYASVATGARNGGVGQPLAALSNSGGDDAAFIDQLTFDEDSVISYEGGLKTAWMDGDLLANIGVFHTTLEDSQLLVLYPAANVINGPDQRILGMELETSYRFSDALSAFFNASVLDTEFADGMASTVGAPPGETAPYMDIRSGNETIEAPSLSFSAGYSYSRPIGTGSLRLTSNGVYQHVGERYSSPQNFVSTKLESLDIINLRVGIEGDRFSVNLFANNLLNDVEATRQYTSATSQFIDGNGNLDASIVSTSVNQPRVVGLSLGVKY